MRRSAVASIVLTVGIPSFIAGGFLWEPLLFHLPRYCLTGIEVIDGDTLRCEWRSIRLEGFDTPEPLRQHARCVEELVIGEIATCQLRSLLQNNKHSVRPTHRRDEHGRHEAQLFIDGFNAGPLLEAKHLAKSWDGKGEKPDWCQMIKERPELMKYVCGTSLPSKP